MSVGTIALGVLALIAGAVALIVPMIFRKVVETNRVHIVQSKKKTTSYGTGQAAGNVYYFWPSWMPIIGVTRIVLPVSNFELPLEKYLAYDKDRVPFILDVVSFFRIADTNVAAQRIASYDELRKQLEAVLQGSVRKILASHDINQIMTDRATFGKQFTEEVTEELKNWGVEPVKNMELMDIRDSEGSKAIANIMAQKLSHIEMESRVAVAKNNQAAETAEIEKNRTIALSKQEAEEQVGKRTAEKELAIGVAAELTKQSIQVQAAETRAKEMAVERVAKVKQAEIDKDAAEVNAQRDKQVAILAAEAALEATKKAAEGVRAQGEAKAAAETALQLAPVQAQITLAKEIGGNPAYQTYLVALETVKAHVAVGSAQAAALQKAEVKIIANTGNATTGATSAMQLFTPEGGLNVGGMLEAFGNTPEGAKLLQGISTKLGITESPAPAKASDVQPANGAA